MIKFSFVAAHNLIGIYDNTEHRLDLSPLNLSRYTPRTPTTPQRRLLSCPQALSPNVLSGGSKSLCPSPTPMFQQLCHAVVYWEKHLLGKSPAHIINPLSSLTSGGSSDGEGITTGSLYRNKSPTPSFYCASPVRRMTIPSVHVLECDTRKIVTLDPIHTLHTDLDDISQPENGVVADAEISATDSESEQSAKEEEDNICETPYVTNENEFLGTVMILKFSYKTHLNCLVYRYLGN